MEIAIKLDSLQIMFFASLIVIIVLLILIRRELGKSNQKLTKITGVKKTSVNISLTLDVSDFDDFVSGLINKAKELLGNNSCSNHAGNFEEENDVDIDNPGVANRLRMFFDDVQDPPDSNEMQASINFKKSGLKFVATLEKSGDDVLVYHVTPGGNALVLKRCSCKSDKEHMSNIVKSVKSSIVKFLNGKLTDEQATLIYAAIAAKKLTRGG